MNSLDPALQRMVDRVRAAAADGTALDIRGGNTKSFYGGAQHGEPLSTRELAGIVSHEPTELVVTARAGTPLAELQAALADRGQCLPFEPPHFSEGATVGGMVAAGLAGPARAAVGSVRDYVLGAELVTGRGQVLRFGGQVMKNVAGYDVSRLLAGSLGVLGLISEVSLKVLPAPREMVTLRFDMAQKTALRTLNEWAGQPLPIDASAWWDDTLAVRLRGAEAAVRAARSKLGGDLVDPAFARGFWDGLRDHRDEFFEKAKLAVNAGAVLWRLSVPSAAPPVNASGEQLIEWGGAQRWVCTTAPAAGLRAAAQEVDGHATMFRAKDKSAGVFAPLAPPLERIHRALKAAFDPQGVFNRGRLSPDL
jgi:glycolate oxidase FAD binding subunit